MRLIVFNFCIGRAGKMPTGRGGKMPTGRAGKMPTPQDLIIFSALTCYKP